MSQRGAPGLLARTYAWAVLAVHPLVPVAWIAAVVVATLTLPSLGGASSAPLEDLVAKDSPALAAQERSAARCAQRPLTLKEPRMNGWTRQK